jgi:putative colanic acid biosynthesis acetyltransferase WcaF
MRETDVTGSGSPAVRVAPGRSLRAFSGTGYDKGAGRLKQTVWFVVLNLVFRAWWCPRSWRPGLLRAFGASVGERVLIRHRVRVLWPWKLSVGDDCWIGEGVWLLNLEPITLGHDVCLSQEAFLCTGSHDPTSASFEFNNAPIRVASGAWVAAQAMVMRGVVIGEGAVVGARAIVSHDVPPGDGVRAGASW